MQLKRFVISETETGRYVATVYAEEFKPYPQRDSFTRESGGNFWIGGVIVGSANIGRYSVNDSGGRSAVSTETAVAQGLNFLLASKEQLGMERIP